MTTPSKTAASTNNDTDLSSFESFSQLVEYSYMSQLDADPEARPDGRDHHPRQVRSGHYVPVAPTPIADPRYVSHSNRLFAELGIGDDLVENEHFRRVFSGDLSVAPPPFKRVGWATGYALSIYGTEYVQQCPFQTGNGYGDGRAISVCEVVRGDKRWEMQLKGGGPTPYCRGADGRAVLRSSVREFLAQEFMHALGVPTSRSLCLYVSTSERVQRPWYSPGSRSFNPDVMVANPVAIATRVAPSFVRVGQVELFARRARAQAHPRAMDELRMIVAHLIEREYRDDIDPALPLTDRLVALLELFRARLTSLVADWIRVGYCQGNFNSDNCAAGGFTLDYGPFGFCERFDPRFQPWTGGGDHFSFFNQPSAAEANFHMFWSALRHLIPEENSALDRLDAVRDGFAAAMQEQLRKMWAAKLGLTDLDAELFGDLMRLLERSRADYTIFFRQLSHIPEDISSFERSFAAPLAELPEGLEHEWRQWLTIWRSMVQADQPDKAAALSTEMKRINPKYTWREWLVAPAYQAAEHGDDSLIQRLQQVLANPYDEQTDDIARIYDRARPEELDDRGGIAHYSCSS